MINGIIGTALIGLASLSGTIPHKEVNTQESYSINLNYGTAVFEDNIYWRYTLNTSQIYTQETDYAAWDEELQKVGDLYNGDNNIYWYVPYTIETHGSQYVLMDMAVVNETNLNATNVGNLIESGYPLFRAQYDTMATYYGWRMEFFNWPIKGTSADIYKVFLSESTQTLTQLPQGSGPLGPISQSATIPYWGLKITFYQNGVDLSDMHLQTTNYMRPLAHSLNRRFSQYYANYQTGYTAGYAAGYTAGNDLAQTQADEDLKAATWQEAADYYSKLYGSQLEAKDRAYQDAWNNGYAKGKDDGYTIGMRVGQAMTSTGGSMLSLFGSVADIPITIINGLSSLTIFNIPIISIIITILFLALIIWVVKRFV